MSAGLVIVVGASFWGGTALMEQHLAVELAEFVPVLYVNPPTSWLSRFRSTQAAAFGTASGLTRVHPTLSILSVRLPPLKDQPWAKRWTLPLLERAIRSAVRSSGHDHVRAAVVASMDPLLGKLGEGVSVYLAKDDYTAGAALVGLPRQFVEGNIRRLCREADLIAAVTPELADRLAAWGGPTIVLPQGCDVEPLEAPAPAPGRPRAAFVGHLSDRIDTSLLLAVSRAGIALTMIGPTQDTMTTSHLDALRAEPGVTWLGAVPHADIAKHLADVTTCLVPYTDTAFNRSSFPLKLLEYLAAGRRVVSVNLPALQQLDQTLIDVADGPDAFAAAVARSLELPLGAEEVRRRADYARQHSWKKRAGDLLGHIEHAENLRSQ